MAQGYTEADLVANRSPVLLSGGSESDRRAWAEEAAGHFRDPGGGLVEVAEPAQLSAALERVRAVVFVPAAGKIGFEGQARIVHCLQTQDERPKFIIAVGVSPAEAQTRGELRDDLLYRLQSARVDLSAPGLRDAIRTRRAARAKEEAKRPPPPTSEPRVSVTRPAPRPEVKTTPGAKTGSTPARKGAAKPAKRR
jgi:hypothetical protein